MSAPLCKERPLDTNLELARVDVHGTSLHDLERRCAELDAQNITISSIDLSHILTGGLSHFGTGQVNYTIRDSVPESDTNEESEEQNRESIMQWMENSPPPSHLHPNCSEAEVKSLASPQYTSPSSSLPPISGFSTTTMRPSSSAPQLTRAPSSRRTLGSETTQHSGNSSPCTTAPSLDSGFRQQAEEGGRRWSSVSSSSSSSRDSASSLPPVSPRSTLKLPPNNPSKKDMNEKEDKVVYWSVIPLGKKQGRAQDSSFEKPATSTPVQMLSVDFATGVSLSGKAPLPQPPVQPSVPSAPRKAIEQQCQPEKIVYWSVAPRPASAKVQPPGPLPRSSSLLPSLPEDQGYGGRSSSTVHGAGGFSGLVGQAGIKEPMATREDRQLASKGWRKVALFRK